MTTEEINNLGAYRAAKEQELFSYLEKHYPSEDKYKLLWHLQDEADPYNIKLTRDWITEYCKLIDNFIQKDFYNQ